MDKQRDIIIERLEQKLKERDRIIAEMPQPYSVMAEDRIAALETKVKELKEGMHGILDELLYQKTIIEEIQQEISPNPKGHRDIISSEYIIAGNTSKVHSGCGKQAEIIVAE